MNRVMIGVSVALAFAYPASAQSQESDPAQALERRIDELVQQMEAERAARAAEIQALREEVEQLRTQMAQQAAAPAQPATPTVTSGFGNIRIGGLIQTWAVFPENDEDNSAIGSAAGGTLDDDDSFRLRRTELYLNGTLVEHRFSWRLMIDPSRAIQSSPETSAAQTRRILQDVYARLHFPGAIDPEADSDWFVVDIGQFKTGLTWEGQESSARLGLMERSFLARTFGDVRDIGIRASGDHGWIRWSAGIFNGEGQNAVSDLNDQWLYAAALAVKPFRALDGFEDSILQGLEVGVSAQAGDTSTTEGNSARHSTPRFGAHVVWDITHPFAEDDTLWFRYEWMRGRRGITGNTIWGEADGWMASAGYRFLSDYEFALRYEHFNPGPVTAAAGAQPFSNVNQWTVGFNWYLFENRAKLQVNYIWSEEPGRGLEVDNDTLMIGIQYSM